MNKKKICFVAQFPPPMHGLAKAVETLYNSSLDTKFNFEKIDITNNKKIFINLFKILISKADLFYFTISQTRGGNFRDLIILKFIHMRKKKCLVHLHGGYYRKLVDNDLPEWQRKANYKAVGRLEGVIVLGESLQSIFEGMVSSDKIFVVPNCVDDEYLLNKKDFNIKLSNLKEREVNQILYLSNFIKTKGYPEVLELARLEKKNCDAGNRKRLHFNFAGKFFDKSDEKYFFEFINNNCLQDYVTYHGIVSGDKKRELLYHCNIFVLLTYYPNEGQPISIIEAMGNGMFIVTTKHAGIPDIVQDLTNGILISENTCEEVYNRIFNEYNIDILKTNYENVKMLYREDIYIKNMMNIFDSLINKE